ncbi:MAG: aminotransferase [Clostridiaceae bacterium]|nr:aminotransferase [Clostridiaceae bacterium]
MNIPMILTRPEAQMPQYAHEDDVGMDIYSAEDLFIRPGETVLVGTGLKTAIPDGYEIQIRPRSGLSYHTMLRIPNSPGTIDPGFRDEIKVILCNTSSGADVKDEQVVYDLSVKGSPKGTYHVRVGDRIAQMVIAKVEKANFTICDSLEGIGCNRNGGFGSTGVKDM